MKRQSEVSKVKKNFLRLKYDFKIIYREPIMIIFAILPLFLMFLFRFGLPPLMEFFALKTTFEPHLYTNYIFALALIMTPYMTGTLAGFIMLDEKDGSVLELILVTPTGFSGYLVTRLMGSVVLSVMYSILGFILYNSMGYSYSLLPGIILLLAIQSSITSLILFSAAKNKVQGLTMAKGLGLLMAPIFFDLLNNSFLKIIGYGSPYYWTYAYLVNENSASLLIGLAINIVWLVGMLILGFRKTYKFI